MDSNSFNYWIEKPLKLVVICPILTNLSFQTDPIPQKIIIDEFDGVNNNFPGFFRFINGGL